MVTHLSGDAPEDPGREVGKRDQQGKEPGRLQVSQKGTSGAAWATGVKKREYLDVGVGGPRHSGYSQFTGKGSLQPEGSWGRQGWLLGGRSLHHGCRRRGQSPKH